MFSFLFVLANLLIGIVLFYNFFYKRRKLPPGPTPLPLIGNLYSFNKTSPEECLLRWRQQYGDLYTFWLGEVPMIYMTGFAKIMETFQKDGETYAGRFNFNELDKLLKGGTFGVIFTEGDHWREQRRFALHIFREFGLGKNLMQEKILGEVELMHQRMEKEIGAGKEVDVGELLDINIGSIINNFLFGYRFDDDKLEEFWKLKNFLSDVLKNSFHPLQIVFQWNPRLFHRLPYFKTIMDQLIQKHKNFNDFFERQIRAHMEDIDFRDLDAPPTDFVEAFLKEKAKRDANGEEGQHGFTIQQLKGLCSDLWIAGQETTSTTLTWGIAYLIVAPEIQAKVQAELDEVVGGADIVVTMANRPAMPYTNAVINEIQRMCNLVPLNVMHRLTRPVNINGYELPQGTPITPQISAILADGEIFENPKEFRPERFLDENGKLKRVEELIPFSVGKRQCLGESLARMELFLFTANLLNRYKFLPGKNGEPSMERHLGGTVQCPPYTCIVQKRTTMQKE